jgi:hypothetical protein
MSSFLDQPLLHEDIQLPTSDEPIEIGLICPAIPKRMGIIVENQYFDIHRMLYKIYFTLTYSNYALRNDYIFQMFLIHFGWIKVMSKHSSFIGSNQVVYTIKQEFFKDMSLLDFLSMVQNLKFHECASTDYYKAFYSLVERADYIDWKSLETNGCADYDFPTQAILEELEHMRNLVRIFKQYSHKLA